MKLSTRTLAATLIAIPMLLLGLAACSNATPTSASTDTTPTSPRQESSSPTDTDLDAWNLRMVQCLRGEGLTIDDPQPGEFPLVQGAPEIVETAQITCMNKVGSPPSATGGEVNVAERLAYGTAFAQCARDAGYDVNDPTEDQAVSIGNGMPGDILAKCSEEGTDAIKK